MHDQMTLFVASAADIPGPSPENPSFDLSACCRRNVQNRFFRDKEIPKRERKKVAFASHDSVASAKEWRRKKFLAAS